jgi:hypothetical protein
MPSESVCLSVCYYTLHLLRCQATLATGVHRMILLQRRRGLAMLARGSGILLHVPLRAEQKNHMWTSMLMCVCGKPFYFPLSLKRYAVVRIRNVLVFARAIVLQAIRCPPARGRGHGLWPPPPLACWSWHHETVSQSCRKRGGGKRSGCPPRLPDMPMKS